jgi:hypothetical protein
MAAEVHQCTVSFLHQQTSQGLVPAYAAAACHAISVGNDRFE